MLKQYFDFKAAVRHDGKYHPIRQLVQPEDPEIQEIARVLIVAEDFVAACQDFVDSFTTYRQEVGDYWAKPRELLEAEAGDCDDKAILLTSLLRNFIPAEEVFCAFGTWQQNGKAEGHMWTVIPGVNGEDQIIEATASSSKATKGKYNLQAIFNDRYAFVYPDAIKDFDLIPVNDLVKA
ncbi:MAG: transglutaminase family protein [Deltaproteobacteria bacterium]|nr:transglutaminase family protein [Deltaproteobacteria bacterium]